MRKFLIIVAASSIALTSGYSFAQSSNDAADDTAIEASAEHKGSKFKREPIDMAKFSRMERLKSADTDGDGVLSREEIEAEALARIVKRSADRMERRLDINRDGKVTLEEVEKQQAKRFALLDTNEDGKLDRHEMRAEKDLRKGGHFKHHGTHGHGKHFRGQH